MVDPLVALAEAIAKDHSKDAVIAAAREALRGIREQRALLRKRSDAIREYAALVAEIPVADLTEGTEGALSDSEKAVVNTFLDQTLATQPDIETGPMVELVKTKAGIPLEDLVDNPSAVIGSMLYQARKRAGIATPATNGNSAASPAADSAATPAVASPQAVPAAPVAQPQAATVP